MGSARGSDGRTTRSQRALARGRVQAGETRAFDGQRDYDPGDEALNTGKSSISLSAGNATRFWRTWKPSPAEPRPSVDVRALIAGSDLFASLKPAAQKAIAAELEEVVLADGDVLFDKGTVEDGLYIVGDGELTVTGERNGYRVALAGAATGATVGEFSAEGAGRRTVTTRAVGRTRLFRLGNDSFARLRRAFPKDMMRLAGAMKRRCEETRLGTVLRASPIFRDLDDTVLHDIEGEMEVVRVPQGAVVGRKGESTDALHMVVSGRLRAWPERQRRSSALLREAGQGDCVDAIGVVSGAPRDQEIRAIRDSALAKLSRPAFERLLNRHPQGINRLTTKVVAEHYQQMCARMSRPVNSSTGFALVPLHRGAPVAEVGRALSAALAGSDGASTLLLDRDACDARSGVPGFADAGLDGPRDALVRDWLERQEFDHGHALFVADDGASNWSRRCLRHADSVLFVADAQATPSIGAIEAELAADGETVGLRKHLVLVHRADTVEPRGTEAWLRLRSVGQHHHVRLGDAADFARLGRIVTGNAVALVLGGGGARGFAHFGVMRAMHELGIPIDMLGGTSVGSLIGAQYAVNPDLKAVFRQTLDLCLGGEEITIPLVSLFAGAKMSKGVAAMVGERRFEDLWRPFFAVSCNLSRAKVTVHDRGPMVDGVLASNTPPGLFPPRVEGGDLLVDGCLLNNVPADVMERYAEGGTIIAVDVSPREDLLANAEYEAGLSGWKVLESKINPMAPPLNVPSIKEIISRATAIGGLARQKLVMDGYADVYLSPPVEPYPVMAYAKAQELADLGYSYAKPILEDWWQARTAAGSADAAAGCRQAAE